jgi:2'-5' RNA ligase
MRTFVAVEIGERMRDEIQAIRERLKGAGAEIKWVEKDNTHLTLKFIGEIASELAPEVCCAVETAASGAEPFEIEIKGAGTFSRRRPSVLWVGVEDPTGSLARLYGALENALEKLGIRKEDRKFSPHITLGRVRSGKRVRELLDALDCEQPADLGRSLVTSLVLFQSKLTPQGPLYSRLAEVPFRGSRSGEQEE